jgi:hypothetical protein
MASMKGEAYPRPWWMTALAIVCLLALVVNVVRDLFLPETRDVEVWLGFEVTGWAAWVTAPVHWAIFAAGAWGFWRCRPWIRGGAAAYLFYVGVSHVVWSEVSVNGRGWPIGLAQAAAASVAAILLLRARDAFERVPREPAG